MPRPVSLSLDLLRTFLLMVRNEGDAAKTMRELGINQPSMSKRLKYLQHADSRVLQRPWLYLDGKTWRLTEEGAKVLPAVEEVVRRYEQLRRYLGTPEETRPAVRFGCGVETAGGLALEAAQEFCAPKDRARLRITTMRGRARIEQVANGSLDLAVVTHSPRGIRAVARRPLHVETLYAEPLVLVAPAGSAEARKLGRWPKTRAPAEAFLGYPVIMLSPDAGIRRGVDRALRRAGVLRELNVALEIGGWDTILKYVRTGLFGVGLACESVVRGEEDLVAHRLDPETFPLIETRVICRRALGTSDELDLSPEAARFYRTLSEVAKRRDVTRKRDG